MLWHNTMLAQVVFFQFGIEEIDMNDLVSDPTTEEEFQQITYTSDRIVSWEEFSTLFETIRRQSMVYTLRMFREEELKQTDWIMTYDNVQTLQNMDEWVVYRQAMRDLPSASIEYKYTDQNTPDLLSMILPKRPIVIRKQPQ